MQMLGLYTVDLEAKVRKEERRWTEAVRRTVTEEEEDEVRDREPAVPFASFECWLSCTLVRIRQIYPFRFHAIDRDQLLVESRRDAGP